MPVDMVSTHAMALQIGHPNGARALDLSLIARPGGIIGDALRIVDERLPLDLRGFGNSTKLFSSNKHDGSLRVPRYIDAFLQITRLGHDGVDR
jgi:hypothetical protein